MELSTLIHSHRRAGSSRRLRRCRSACDTGIELGSTAAEQARNRLRVWKALLLTGPDLGHDWLVVRAIGRTREPTPMLNLRTGGFEQFREIVDVGSACVADHEIAKSTLAPGCDVERQ